MFISSPRMRRWFPTAPSPDRKLTLGEMLELVSKGLKPPYEALPPPSQLRGLQLRLALDRTSAQLLPHERERLEQLATRLESREERQGKQYVVMRVVPDRSGTRAPMTLHFTYPPGGVPEDLRPFALPLEEVGPLGAMAVSLPEPEEDPRLETFRRNLDRLYGIEEGNEEG